MQCEWTDKHVATFIVYSPTNRYNNKNCTKNERELYYFDEPRGFFPALQNFITAVPITQTLAANSQQLQAKTHAIHFMSTTKYATCVFCCVQNSAFWLSSEHFTPHLVRTDVFAFAIGIAIRCRTALPLKRATFLFIYTKLPLHVLCVAVDFSQWIWIQSFVSLWRT